MMAAGVTQGFSLERMLDALVMTGDASIHGVRCLGLSSDSRQVRPGDVFFALSGTRQDGGAFIGMALDRGAVAVIHESPVDDLLKENARRRQVPMLHDPALREHLGIFAGRFHGDPSRHLKVVAVTGTDGKTSVSHFVAQAIDILTARVHSCGIIGTTGNGFYKSLTAGTHTTPDALTLQSLLADMLAQKAAYVSMEASSHALEQGRMSGMHIEVAILTNLGRDHLDYHLNLEAYRQAKSRLFAWPDLQSGVLNIQDEFGRDLWDSHHRRYPITVYGIGDADFDLTRAEDWVWGRIAAFHDKGFLLRLSAPEGNFDIEASLLGSFNAKNVLAVASTLRRLNFGMEEIAKAIAKLRPVRGRMQLLEKPGYPSVIIDYAHTPQALETVLKEARRHVTGRLHCVFGCGGNRDAGKRPLMGGIAARFADRVIVTDDNPRNEPPQKITADILAGCSNAGSVQVIHDRAQAILAALDEAVPGDVVLVAGKGHETYQEIAGVKKPFSDQSVVCTAFGMREDGDEVQ
ncbi:MAG TPA: UDP-N-acetylmuramoyl-L-alanyl-D-glutamate--2,6-diaminopimelate ligase [Gammaproteobacteria bacterium]|nr:UDP-N-acetylmuramoyl-L-alanyl-D-glutamate--2,6-diaminopimelate ligase [Gammaproteobacteria bacterium]